jgi:TRAP-type C4-dicarboxylate transport system permease small subunit
VLGLLLLALGTAADVVLRYAFARPIRGFADVVGLAGAVLLSACMPHLVASRGNIAIDVLGRTLGPRARAALDRVAAVATFAFFAAMAWQCTAFAADMQANGDAMPVLRWPVWPWWTAVATGIAATALVAGLALLRPAASAPR